MKLLLAFAVASLVALPVAVGDHPGHGEIKVMAGKVIVIKADRIQIEYFDRTSLSTKSAWVFVDDKTKVTNGKARLSLTDLKLGQEIDCMAETEIGKDDITVLRAVQIRLKQNEVHEDLGIYSFDTAAKRVRFRQFHVEGFVIHYVQEPDTKPGTWVYTSEAIENIPKGYRSRETHVQLGPDEFEEVFELADPGKEFQVYSRTRFKRVR